MARYFSIAMLIGVILLVTLIFYRVMASFLVPLFLAALLVVIFRPLHEWMIKKCKGRQNVAAIMTTSAVLLAVLTPIALLFLLATAEAREIIDTNEPSTFLEKFKDAKSQMGLDIPAIEEIRSVESRINAIKNDMAPSRLDAHDLALLEIQQEAEGLGKAYGFVASDTVEENKKSDAGYEKKLNSWNAFSDTLNHCRELQGQATDDTSNTEALATYHDELIKVSDEFSTLKDNLLGGRVIGLIKSFLNPTGEQLESRFDSIVGYALQFGKGTTAFLGSFMLGVSIMVIALYYFLLDGPSMIQSFKGLSPLDDLHEQELIDEFARVSRAVVIATLLSALVQGLLAGIGFYFAGLQSIFLLTLLSACFALIPFVGAAAIWMPCCLYLFFIQGETVPAVGLAIYGFAIISMADNVIKPFVLHGQSNLHPLLALLSVLGGVTALGPLGILVGPMIVAFLQTLLKILQREVRELESTPAPLLLNGGGAQLPSNQVGFPERETAPEDEDVTEGEVSDSVDESKDETEMKPAPEKSKPSSKKKKKR